MSVSLCFLVLKSPSASSEPRKRLRLRNVPYLSVHDIKWVFFKGLSLRNPQLMSTVFTAASLWGLDGRRSKHRVLLGTDVLSAHTQLEPRVVDMSQEMHCGCIKKTSKLCHTLARRCTCWLSGSWKCMSVHGAHTRPSSNAAISFFSIRFSVPVRSWGVK